MPKKAAPEIPLNDRKVKRQFVVKPSKITNNTPQEAVVAPYVVTFKPETGEVISVPEETIIENTFKKLDSNMANTLADKKTTESKPADAKEAVKQGLDFILRKMEEERDALRRQEAAAAAPVPVEAVPTPAEVVPAPVIQEAVVKVEGDAPTGEPPVIPLTRQTTPTTSSGRKNKRVIRMNMGISVPKELDPKIMTEITRQTRISFRITSTVTVKMTIEKALKDHPRIKTQLKTFLNKNSNVFVVSDGLALLLKKKNAP